MRFINFVLFAVLLTSCSMYNDLSNEEKKKFELASIDLVVHDAQPNSVIYSLTSEEFRELVKISKNEYQLMCLHIVTCHGVRATMIEFVKYFKDFINTDIYLITPSDQIWKNEYLNFWKNFKMKKYMLSSEIYSHSFYDAYAQGHSAKDKFIKELCSTCNNHPGSLVFIMFDKKLNVLLYTDSKYFDNIYNKELTSEQNLKIVVEKIYNDIISIVKND